MNTLQEKVKNCLENLVTDKDHELADLIYDLGYEYENEPVNMLTRNWTDIQKELVDHIIRLGAHGEFSIIWVRLNSDRLLRTAQRTIINLINYHFPYNMIIFSNLDDNVWDFINMKSVKEKESEEDKEPKKRQFLRRIRIDQQERLRTAVERISFLKVPEAGIHHFDLQKQHDEAFDVEKVTDAFFNEFKIIFAVFKKHLISLTDDQEWAHDYGLHFLNRLIFLYFIQKKRWLGKNPEFIKSYWETYKNTNQPKNSFVSQWLSILFFEAFNNKFSHPQWLPKEYRSILQMAPFLNGGLFKRNELDIKYSIQIQDDFFEKVFNFLQSYNFTIAEDSPIEQEVAVDPEMIGKIFETMTFVEGDVEEAHARGIIYTPRTEITLMCRLVLVDRLTNEFGEKHKNRFYELLFALTEEDKNLADEQIAEINLWPDLFRFLQEITIVDPAVGSGSFLVGMLNILTDLNKRANSQLGNHFTDYHIKKQIINKSLYGVDVMDWAVHVCELRLWLQLVVETELKPGERNLEPLLPNLNLKIRIGDSLVQEVGGVKFSHLKLLDLPSHLKGKLTQLMAEKRKFFINEEKRKYKTKREINREELRLFRKIIENQIDKRNESIKIIDKIIGRSEIQKDLYGGEQKISPPKEKIRDKEKIKQELTRYKEARRALKDRTDIPFVWNVSFAEIFGEDKNGFDIVIGNPPYVRQELISNPYEDPENFGGESADEWKNAKKTYKEKLMNSVYAAFPDFFHYRFNEKKAKRKMDGKNDLYVYFYLHGLSLLNKKGSFCFVTSNSWLDVGYGKDLQEFLITKVPIKMIIDNNIKRTFSSADVNTVISLFGSPGKNELKKSLAKFVMFYIPFDQCLDPILFEEIEEAQERKTSPEYRVVPKTAEKLLEGGLNTEKKEKHIIDAYVGDKWGGKYLRAPDIYFTILEKGRNKLVRLGDIAEVIPGCYSGINDFFYLNKGTAINLNIEDQYLVPLIRNTSSINSLFTVNDPDNFVFACHENWLDIKSNAKRYIKWGEKQVTRKRQKTAAGIKWPQTETVKRRKPGWWAIPNKNLLPANLFMSYVINDRFYCPLSKKRLVSDRCYHRIFVDDNITVAAFLNTTITALFVNIMGTRNLGQGGLKFETKDAKNLEIFYDPGLIKVNNLIIQLGRRLSKSIYEECGFDKSQSLRSQEPNPLPDRKALDDIVFDAIGLTGDERKEVYWATCELVQRRLEKARSV